MTCEVREKKFTHEGQSITIAINAFRTGSGKVVLVASSQHRRLQMDFVTVNDTTAKLWKDDREGFKKLSFSLECSIFNENERKDTHNEYYLLFSELDIKQVTAFHGHREWHIARKLSLTSTSTHALIKALLRHNMDFEHDFIRTVCEYMCPNYNHDERVRKHVEEQQRTEEEEAEQDDEEIDATGTYTDEYLLEHGVPTLVEDWELSILQARYDMLLFEWIWTSSLER